MKTFCVKVVVKLKPSVPDSKGVTLKNAIESLFLVQNLTCRVGTWYNFKFDATNQAEALNLVKKIAYELLTNEFAEDFEIRSMEEIVDLC